jgi:hypothetical protein
VSAALSAAFGISEVASGDDIAGAFRLMLAAVLSWIADDLRRKQTTPS